MLPDALLWRPPVETNSTDDKNINKFIKRALVIRHEVCLVDIINPVKAKRQNGAINKNVKAPEGSLE